MKAVLLDTAVGVIVRLLRPKREGRHQARCVAAIKGLERPLDTCEAVVAASCHLVRGLPGAVNTVRQNIERQVFQIPFQVSRSAASVRSILRKYRDRPTDFADACLIHLAEDLYPGDILTLDSNFRSPRSRRNRPFSLLVPPDRMIAPPS